MCLGLSFLHSSGSETAVLPEVISDFYQSIFEVFSKILLLICTKFLYCWNKFENVALNFLTYQWLSNFFLFDYVQWLALHLPDYCNSISVKSCTALKCPVLLAWNIEGYSPEILGTTINCDNSCWDIHEFSSTSSMENTTHVICFSWSYRFF